MIPLVLTLAPESGWRHPIPVPRHVKMVQCVHAQQGLQPTHVYAKRDTKWWMEGAWVSAALKCNDRWKMLYHEKIKAQCYCHSL